MKTDYVLVSGAVVFKKAKNGRIYWLVVKQNKDSNWGIPKIIARRGESSVKAVLKMMSEQVGMTTKVLEEVGRFGGSTTINRKVIPRRVLYYLMTATAESEALEFYDYSWHTYSKALRILGLKKEKQMLSNAKKEYKVWLKKQENLQ